ERVEDVAAGGVEPPDVLRAAVEGQQADAGGVARVPPVGQRGALGRGRHVEGDRQVEDHDVPVGDGAVVDHRAVGDRDADLAPHPGVLTEHDVPDVVPRPVVGDAVQVAGDRVGVGVGREGAV